MRRYDHNDEYNASSDDDSDMDPNESDSEGENSYRPIHGMKQLKRKNTHQKADENIQPEGVKPEEMEPEKKQPKLDEDGLRNIGRINQFNETDETSANIEEQEHLIEETETTWRELMEEQDLAENNKDNRYTVAQEDDILSPARGDTTTESKKRRPLTERGRKALQEFREKLRQYIKSNPDEVKEPTILQKLKNYTKYLQGYKPIEQLEEEGEMELFSRPKTKQTATTEEETSFIDLDKAEEDEEEFSRVRERLHEEQNKKEDNFNNLRQRLTAGRKAAEENQGRRMTHAETEAAIARDTAEGGEWEPTKLKRVRPSELAWEGHGDEHEMEIMRHEQEGATYGKHKGKPFKPHAYRAFKINEAIEGSNKGQMGMRNTYTGAGFDAMGALFRHVMDEYVFKKDKPHFEEDHDAEYDKTWEEHVEKYGRSEEERRKYLNKNDTFKHHHTDPNRIKEEDALIEERQNKATTIHQRLEQLNKQEL